MMCEECRYFVKYWWQDKKVRRCTNPDSVFRGQQRHGGGFCEILRSVYPPGKCPWCKPDENITNGKRYRRVK